MIVSYRDKRTREFAAGKRVKAFSGIERSAQLKLDRLEAAVSLKDLAALPGNHFEALLGDRKGQDRGLSLGRETWHGPQFTQAISSPKN
jgi:proteic killer suppression protein